MNTCTHFSLLLEVGESAEKLKVHRCFAGRFIGSNLKVHIIIQL